MTYDTRFEADQNGGTTNLRPSHFGADSGQTGEDLRPVEQTALTLANWVLGTVGVDFMEAMGWGINSRAEITFVPKDGAGNDFLPETVVLEVERHNSQDPGWRGHALGCCVFLNYPDSLGRFDGMCADFGELVTIGKGEEPYVDRVRTYLYLDDTRVRFDSLGLSGDDRGGRKDEKDPAAAAKIGTGVAYWQQVVADRYMPSGGAILDL